MSISFCSNSPKTNILLRLFGAVNAPKTFQDSFRGVMWQTIFAVKQTQLIQNGFFLCAFLWNAAQTAQRAMRFGTKRFPVPCFRFPHERYCVLKRKTLMASGVASSVLFNGCFVVHFSNSTAFQGPNHTRRSHPLTISKRSKFISPSALEHVGQADCTKHVRTAKFQNTRI